MAYENESDADVQTRISEAEEFLEALRSGNLHIGMPFEGRTEAKIADLQRQISMWRSILDRRQVQRRAQI